MPNKFQFFETYCFQRILSSIENEVTNCAEKVSLMLSLYKILPSFKLALICIVSGFVI